MARPALSDTLTRGQVLLERLKAGEVRKVDAFLRELDRALRDRLTREDLTQFNRQRLDALLIEIERIAGGIHARYAARIKADVAEIAEQQTEFAVRALERATPASVIVATPTPGLVSAAVLTSPLHVAGPKGGMLLGALIDDWSASETEAVTNAIRLGVVQGQTTADIVKTIRGTKANNYADGLLAVEKRHAEAVVRTAVQHVGDVARLEVYKANSDIVESEQWVATLDSRTTEICMALDGQVFPLDEGPRPPAHINCRSVRVPKLAPEFEFLSEGATRASVNGQVDAGLSYFDWLKTQPADFQDVALGPTRGQLFREGGLSAGRFAALQLGRDFAPLTLAEMRKLEPLAFRRAGLD